MHTTHTYITHTSHITHITHTSHRVLITAVDKSTTDLTLRLFNNCFSDEFGDERKCVINLFIQMHDLMPTDLVWKVARYTSAAPPCFTECDNYVDGGILAHNPSEVALNRIEEFQRARDGKIASLLSLGSGVFPPQLIGNLDVGVNPFTIFERMTNLVTVLTTAVSLHKAVWLYGKHFSLSSFFTNTWTSLFYLWLNLSSVSVVRANSMRNSVCVNLTDVSWGRFIR